MDKDRSTTDDPIASSELEITSPTGAFERGELMLKGSIRRYPDVEACFGWRFFEGKEGADIGSRGHNRVSVALVKKAMGARHVGSSGKHVKKSSISDSMDARLRIHPEGTSRSAALTRCGSEKSRLSTGGSENPRLSTDGSENLSNV